MDYQEFVERGQRARRETEDFINSHIHDQRKRWPLMCRSGLARRELLRTEAFGARADIRANVTIPIISPDSGEGRVAEQSGPKAG